VAEAYLKHVSGLERTWESTVNATNTFLTDVRVCDVGCGGGILSEALAECGATVTGVDMLPAAIKIAKRHWDDTHDAPSGEKAKKSSAIRSPEYVCQAIEEFAAKRAGSFDVVICSEVLEHVTDPVAFAAHCCVLVRPGGCVVFTTINRTVWALLGAIILPEDVLGIIPRFCHHLHMCVTPGGIKRATDKMGFRVVKTTGLALVPMGLEPRDVKWMPSPVTSLWYGLVAKCPE